MLAHANAVMLRAVTCRYSFTNILDTPQLRQRVVLEGFTFMASISGASACMRRYSSREACVKQLLHADFLVYPACCKYVCSRCDEGHGKSDHLPESWALRRAVTVLLRAVVTTRWSSSRIPDCSSNHLSAARLRLRSSLVHWQGRHHRRNAALASSFSTRWRRLANVETTRYAVC